MRKNRKQITALVLAMGMTAAGCMTGYAALDVDPTEAAANPSTVTGDNGSAVSELIGQIDATTLSVTLPLKAGFNIDPTIYTEDNVTTQIGGKQSAQYKIINNSAVPVYVYISQVGTNKDKDGAAYAGAVTDMKLVTTKEGLSASHSVMLAVKDATVDVSAIKPGTGDTGFWLEEKGAGDTYKYMLNGDKGKIAAKTGSTPTELNLKVYGLTKTGWNHQDKFAVTPTFMVTTTEPTV